MYHLLSLVPGLDMRQRSQLCPRESVSGISIREQVYVRTGITAGYIAIAPFLIGAMKSDKTHGVQLVSHC